MKTPSLLTPRAALLRHRLAPAAALLLSFSPLPADDLPLTPVIQSGTGLAGERTKLVWSPRSNVRYRVEKSTSLSPEGEGAWSTRALVEGGEWLDPEPPGPRAFYRVPAPLPEVFSVYPTVLGSAGGVLIIEGQCLPAGSSLVFEIEGAPPLVLPLMPGAPGTYRAALPAGAVVPGANILSATIRGPNEVVLLDIKENFAVTETGRASEPPPRLPPALEWVETVWNKQCVEKDTTVRLADREYDTALLKRPPQVKVKWGILPEFDGGAPEPLGSFLMPALMKAKEKANRTKCANNLRMGGLLKEEGGRHTPFHNKYRPQYYTGSLPGEVCMEHDDLILDTPAGPPIAWTRTYRSKNGGGGGGAGGWATFADIRIEPIPLAAGANAPRLYLYGGDGRRDLMVRQEDGSYTCTGMFREGRFNPDTSFTLTFADKSQFIFCRLVGAPWSGRIGRIQDSNGIGLDFTYNASSQLHTVTSQFGQSLTCAYGPTGQLASLTDHTGRFIAYDYYQHGQPGGNQGDLKSISCPQVQGRAPLTGPTAFTYSTGYTDDRLNHNLLSVTDGAGRVIAEFAYSSVTDPAHIEFDTCLRLPLLNYASIEFATIKIELGAAGYKMFSNDPLGRVTECDFDLMHRCTAVREYTGFATPGEPVTSTTNRPDYSKRLRASDPAFYETTFRYNADSCVTRITHPDGTQERNVYGRDLRKDCPVRERGNAHLITLRAPDGDERTVTFDFLPELGPVEGGGGGGGGAAVGDAASNPIPGIGVVIKGYSPGGMGGGLGVWDGGDGNGGCTDDDFLFGKTGATGSKAKAWMVNNFAVQPIFGLKTEWITSIGLPKITPKIAKESHGRVKVQFHWDREGKNDANSSCWVRMVTSHGQVFTCNYDSHGNLTSCRTPVAGSGRDATYNSLGQCTSVTVLNGAGSSFREQCTYDAATGWMTGHIVDPDVNGTGAGLHIATTCERDNLGRITRVVDPRGFDWLTDYNALDLVVREQSPPVGTAPTASRSQCDFFHDSGGKVTICHHAHRDATGALDPANPAYSAFIVYDNRGHVVRLACEQRPVNVPSTPPMLDPSPLGLENFAVWDFNYDAAGQCVRVSTPAISRGQSTDAVCDYQYDECGQLYRSSLGGTGHPTGVHLQYDYDPFGACVKASRRSGETSLGDFVIVRAFDKFHRLSSITDPMGNVTRYEYDEQGFTTVSVFGEVNDVSGALENVLLARGRGRPAMTFGYVFWEPMGIPGGGGNFGDTPGLNGGDMAGKQSRSGRALRSHELAHVVQQRGGAGFRPAFFNIFGADDVSTWERFAPGATAPHATETTTVSRSPAGLEMSCSTNGDFLYSCTYDTAGRPATMADVRTIHSTVRDQAGNVILNGRTDLSTVPGAPERIFTWTSIFDEMGRRISTTDGGGNTVLCRYDSLSRPTQCTDPRGVVHHFRYDGEIPGVPGTPPVPFTSVHECDVDNDGFPDLLELTFSEAMEARNCTNSNGYTTTLTRDAAGRVTQIDFPDGTHEVHGFDSYGRLNGIVHRDLATRILLLDANGRVLQDAIDSPVPGTVPVPPVVRTYNGLGQCMQCNQGDSHLAFTWDSLGNQLSESHNGRTVTRAFNHHGRTSVVYPDGTSFVEARDAWGNPTSVSRMTSTGMVISPPVTQMEYQGHRVSGEIRANGVVTTHTYRANGDLPLPGGTEDFSYDECVRTVCTNGTGGIIYSTRVRRDRAQNVTQHDTFYTGVAQSTGRRHVQAWDRLDRLVASTIQRREQPGAPFVDESVVLYTIDLEGRRLSVTGGANPGAYTQNPAIPPGDHQMGQYSSWSHGALEWDEEGCLTMMSGSTGMKQFVYDADSRLVAVNDPNTGAALATYAYSADGRRTRSSTGSGDPLVPPVDTFFVYDGATCIQELGGDGLPNVTMAATGGVHLCVISRNGTLVYPHGGGSTDVANGVAIPKFLDHMKKGKRSEAELSLRAAGPTPLAGSCFASPDGTVTERTDRDEAGAPVFLTSNGVIRQAASGTLSGCDWFYTRIGYGVNTRSDTYLSCDRYCPETGFLQGHGTVYSPQLGQPVGKEKKRNPPGLSATRGIAVDCRL